MALKRVSGTSPSPSRAQATPPLRHQRASIRHRQARPNTSIRTSHGESVLTNVRQARGIHSTISHNQEAVVSGVGRHLGINIQWRIRWRADGAFQEAISGKELGFEWGYDGAPDSSCWEIDSSGVARSLEYDDHEALLLGAWVRTGLWLQPELSSKLDIQVVDADARPELGGITNGNGNGVQDVTPNAQEPAQPQPVVLTIRLVGGKLVNRIRVCPSTWAVQGLDQPMCGDTEVWQFGTWKAWQHNVCYPEHSSHQAVAGGHHVYLAQAGSVSVPSPITYFQCPATPVLPCDTRFLPGIPPELPVWRAGSGHLLVRPQINGQEGGYMVVDTGASGFVITPTAAVSLGLDAFGELYAASVTGKIPAQFVKARTWSLGPLHISAPVMMTMLMDGLVRDGPPGGDVIGIVGYDIFRRAVIELPQMATTSHTTSSISPIMPSHASIPLRAVASTSASHPQHQAADGTSLQGTGQLLSVDADSIVSPFAPHGDGLQPSLQGTGTRPAAASSTDDNNRGADGRNGNGNGNGGGGAAGFLQGILSAASAGWAGSRNRVHSSTAGEALASASTSLPGAGSSVPSVAPLPVPLSAGGAGRSGWTPAWSLPHACQQYTMRLFNPDEYDGAQAQGWTWHPFCMIASLPHLEVHFLGADGQPVHVLLMMDSGACGADIMLHARAMKELDLQKLSRPTSHFVRGVGGASTDNSVKVELIDLAWVELAGLRFNEVRCMYAGVGGLDISLYSAGILCCDLLTRLPTCYDYARKRMGFKYTP